MSGVERQFWESFEGWARRRMAERLRRADCFLRPPYGVPLKKQGREQIEAAREIRLGLAASVARGSSLGLPQ